MKKTNANATMITNIIKKATGRRFSNKEIFTQPVIAFNDGKTRPAWLLMATYMAVGIYYGAKFMALYKDYIEESEELSKAKDKFKETAEGVSNEIRRKAESINWEAAAKAAAQMGSDEDPFENDEAIKEASKDEVPEDIRARIDKMRKEEKGEEVEDPLVAAIKRWRKA